jgi:hypothetical protein
LRKKKRSPDASEESKWAHMFNLIFPGNGTWETPSPCRFARFTQKSALHRVN